MGTSVEPTIQRPTQLLSPVIISGAPSAYQEFLSGISKYGGFAKLNKFVVLIDVPDLNGVNHPLNFLCDQVVFPGRTINTSPLRINNITRNIPKTVDYQQTSVSMIFNVDAEFKIVNLFSEWLDLVVQPISRTVKESSDYSHTISLHALSSEVEKITESHMCISLYNAFPVKIQNIQFSNNNPNPVKIKVDFVFKYWDCEYIEDEAAPGIESRLQGLGLNITLKDPARRGKLIIRILAGNALKLIRDSVLKNNRNIAKIIRKVDSIPFNPLGRITRRF